VTIDGGNELLKFANDMYCHGQGPSALVTGGWLSRISLTAQAAIFDQSIVCWLAARNSTSLR
jgi:hypothetical protein